MTAFRNDIPFDQYARYRDLRHIVELSRGQTSWHPSEFSILDVGGFFQPISGGPYLPLKIFFPDASTVVLDRTHTDSGLADYLIGDGLDLPFGDQSFDWVNASDTLEHIPIDRRQTFIKELLRCSRKAVTISAPIGNEAVQLAENLVVAYLKRVLKFDHQALMEHRQCGLPVPEDVVDQVKQIDPQLECEVLPSGNLYRWVYLMLSRHLYISLAPQEGLNPEMDALFNTLLYDSDHVPPTYRNIYLITQPPHSHPIHDRFLTLFHKPDSVNRPDPPPESLILDIFARIDDQERWALIRNLQDKVVELTSALSQAQAQANYYQRELAALADIPPVRIWRKVKGWLPK
ncbi:class I SAM-dependent methyltransferase [bacterium]|nr:class I SAM-dependent methyltransferase [bacterium]